MTTHGDSPLHRAVALLLKADSSSFSAEQASLALGAYRDLALYLNGLESQSHGGPRRERRLLVDRRSGPRPVPLTASDTPTALRARNKTAWCAPGNTATVRGAYVDIRI